MDLIEFKGRNSSSYNNLNLLYREGKTFIMDNHLAASWCWAKEANLNESYNLFHIDRHYDMLASQIDDWILELRNRGFSFAEIPIEELVKIDYAPAMNPTNDRYQLFRWDNYMTIFHKLYPTFINIAEFATHKDGDKLDYFEIYEQELWDLPENMAYWINENSEKKWIVNIDIDFFFQDYDDNYYQFLSDEYVAKIGNQLKLAWENIDVLTIALSPEMCGGWKESERIAKILCDSINVSFPI